MKNLPSKVSIKSKDRWGRGEVKSVEATNIFTNMKGKNQLNQNN